MEQQKRHAFLITAHNKKEMLLNLLALLDDPEHDIYIHIDKKAREISETELTKAAPHSRVSFVPRLDARWGSEVFIDAIVSLIELASREEHAFYHLLSGVDLPLKPMREIRAYFEAHAGEEFVAFERNGGAAGYRGADRPLETAPAGESAAEKDLSQGGALV